MFNTKLKITVAVLASVGILPAIGGLPWRPLELAAQTPEKPTTAQAKKSLPIPDEMAKLATVIKPRPEENKWQQIPWITDFNEGVRQAKAEKRPILLWTILGEPLDEC